jgi:phosphotransferase system enzyme I (PtsI)
MAGDVRFTRLLLGMGLLDFSMHPAHILSVKQRVLTSELQAAKTLVARMRNVDEPAKLASLLNRLNG